MQTDPKDNIVPSFIKQRRDPKEIVADMINRFLPESLSVPYRPIQKIPKHHMLACAITEAQIRRAACSETFKTWGTPQEIADSMFKVKVPPSLPSILGGFFPSPPTPQNQLSSDVPE